MGTALALLGVAFASALIPLINIEAYLVGLGVLVESAGVWGLALVAGLGQMFGKVIWYYLGANALRWSPVRRRVETPRFQEKLERWRDRVHARPLAAATLVLVSSLTGFPPFAIISVLAGQLRMNLAMFFTVGLLGRTLRFAAFLGGADAIAGVLFPG